MEWIKLKTVVIVAHPDYSDSSTQQFLLESGKHLEEVCYHFIDDKEIEGHKERQLLEKYDRIIFQFPMYWYSAPYELKKWIDQVFDDSFIKGRMEGKELGLVVTLGVAEESFAAGKAEKFTLSELFRPFEALASKCQMIYLPIFSVSLFHYMSEVNRKALLVKYQQYLTKSNEATFKSEEEWFITYLEKYRERFSDERKGRIDLILNQVKENRETLDDLLVLVKEMREDAY